MAGNNTPRVPIIIRDAAILPGGWRNFSGREDQYNKTGKREFNIALPQDVANALAEQGLNVKVRETEEGEKTYYLKCTASWKIKAPQIYLISGNQKTLLSEELVGILDDADIIKADITLDAVPWDVNGRSGLTAYLAKAYITIVQDELDEEYANIPLAH